MPPPPEIDANVALLVVMVPYVPSTESTQAAAPAEATPAPAEAAPKQLPKTGTLLPLVGLLGGLFFVLALGLKARRAFSS